MGNSPITTVHPDKIEDKTNPVSRKVWELKRHEKVFEINADGTVPYDVQKQIQHGKLHMTNYVNSSTGKRTALTRINNEVILIEMTQP